MKLIKTTMATALGALTLSVSGMALAQSNVTIYGVVDAGYFSTRGHDATGSRANFSGIVAGVLSGSRLGLRGEENLGNGLSAIYTLEYAINNDDNAGVGMPVAVNPTAARQQFVGLKSSKWGQVTMGRQYAPGFMDAAKNDASQGALFSPQAILSAYSGSTFSPGGSARINNSIAYKSPNMSGFVFDAIYGFGEQVGNRIDGKKSNRTDSGFIGLGLGYANGPLSLDLGYQSQQNRMKSTNIGTDDINEWFIGGNYNFQVVKLFASYQDLSNKTRPNSTGDFKIYNLGVAVPVSNSGTVNVSYAGYRPEKGSSNNSKAWNIGYVHALSKRTKLYTGYTRVDNDRNSIPGRVVTTSGTLAGGATGTAQDNGSFYAGINHAF